MKTSVKISIVDDHPFYRDGIKSMLSECTQFQFLSEACNGQEFIDSLPNGIPDIVLLDVEMPVMNGDETTAFLNKHFPEIKIIILTMYHDAELAFHLMKKGIRGYLVKEADIDELKEAIESVMNIGYHFNDFVRHDIYERLVNGKSIKPQFEKNSLTYREKQVVSLLCNQYICKEVADELSLDVRTVNFHKETIMKKIGARNTAGIVVYGIENDLKNIFGYKKKKK